VVANVQQSNPYLVGIVALAGALIGVAGGAFNQALAARRQRQDAIAQALRAERREIYAAFLLATEKVKQLIARSTEQTQEVATGPTALKQTIADLWEVQAQLSLISGEEIRRIAHETVRFREAQVTAVIEGREVPRQRPPGASRHELRDAMQEQLGVRQSR
jgi:hypothetical protein